MRLPMLVPTLILALLGAPAFAHDPPQAPSRAIEFPDVPGYLTLVVDLHTHSVFSDGEVWPTIRVEEARRDGVDLMAVTEHIEYQPHADDIPHPDRNRSFELASGHTHGEHDVIVVNGAEVTRDMPPGHVNAVFLSDANALRTDEAEEAFLAAKAQGAFVFWNHPSWVGQRRDGVALADPKQVALFQQGLIQGIEVANGTMFSNEAMQIALDHQLAILGTSDIHGLIDWDYDVHGGAHRTVTLVFAKERTEESIREALFAQRTAAWTGNTLIGRAFVVRPLVDASLTVEKVARRADNDVIDVTFRNVSDARFELMHRGKARFYDRPSLLGVPPHGTLTVGIAGEPRDKFQLEFDVLNVVTAPGSHPRLSIPIEVPAR